MRILFLSLLDFSTFEENNIYTDLLREFIKNGHDVYCISPGERRTGLKTHLKEDGHLLKLRIGNTQKTNIIEKGISTLMIEGQFVSAIKKYFSDIRFDLVLYSTPPITFASVVRFVKKRDGAKTYLMLKDIFPQNAVDIGLMRKKGIQGLIYKYFRSKEKKLYSLSDRIGCMSQANVDYLLQHNPEISEDRAEVCPNCIEVCDVRLSEKERAAMRQKYGLPHDKKIFVYGGNLGKPQDVPFIVDCLKNCSEQEDSYFVIAGNGTERHILEQYKEKENSTHLKLMGQLQKREYDEMIACCDVGLIFLDHRFSIPNFPSRLLSYMQAGLPVLACTDKQTDVGRVITKGDFGWWCESTDCREFCRMVKMICNKDLSATAENSFEFLQKNFSSAHLYSILERSFYSMEGNGEN